MPKKVYCNDCIYGSGYRYCRHKSNVYYESTPFKPEERFRKSCIDINKYNDCSMYDKGDMDANFSFKTFIYRLTGKI